MHPFDIATSLESLPDGTFRGRTSADYANMIGPFGGVIAASMLRAPMQHPARIGEPIALTVNYAAPLGDGDFIISVRPLRTNRSTQHWAVELRQGGELAISASAVFATRRESWSSPEVLPPADVAAPDTLLRAATISQLAWTTRIDMRFAHGALPDVFDGQSQSVSVSHVWLRDEPPRPLDFISLASLCDSFFPRVVLRMHKAVPIGTVSMTTFFHADAAMLETQGARHLLGSARGIDFRDGYFEQGAELWSDDRRLLATSHQMVYFRG